MKLKNPTNSRHIEGVCTLKASNQMYINIIKFLTHLGLQLCFPHDQTDSCSDPRKLCRSTKRLCSNFQSLGVEWQFSSSLAAADRNRQCSLDLWCLIRRFSIHPTLGLKEQYQLKREVKIRKSFFGEVLLRRKTQKTFG